MSEPAHICLADLAIMHSILRETLTADARVWFFGSRVKRSAKDSSDLGLAVDAGRALTRKEQVALSDAFEEFDIPHQSRCCGHATLPARALRPLLNRIKWRVVQKLPVPYSPSFASIRAEMVGILMGKLLSVV